jgi:hypothetical protein
MELPKSRRYVEAMKAVLSVVFLMMSACASTKFGACEFSLSQSGWMEVSRTSAIHSRQNSKHWYSNKNGDYLICDDVRAGECNGMYELFERQQDGTYVDDYVVCTE